MIVVDAKNADVTLVLNGVTIQNSKGPAVFIRSAGTVVKLTDSSGNVLTEHTADRSFSCVILGRPSLKQGETCALTAGTSTTTIQMTSTVYGSGGGGWGMPGLPPSHKKGTVYE